MRMPVFFRGWKFYIVKPVSVPKFRFSPGEYISTEFRLEQQAWFDNLFGFDLIDFIPAEEFLIEGNCIFCKPNTYEALKQSIIIRGYPAIIKY